MIVELPEIQIPATGGDYFPTPNLTLPLSEDRWIRAVEIRPGNREVTHHSVIFSARRVGTGAAPFAVNGLVQDDGSIRASVEPIDNGRIPFKEFTGSAK